MQKLCTKCNIIKTFSEFHAKRASPDGYSSLCKSCKINLDKIWYQKHKQTKLQQQRQWKQINRLILQIKRKKRDQENREQLNTHKQQRLRSDINFKLSTYLRSRINKALKNNIKPGSAIKDLGCTLSEFKAYIESKFQPGMSWGNYGYYGWHLDHIIPLAKFNLMDPIQFKKACHYTNMQPLWAKDNLRKGDK